MSNMSEHASIIAELQALGYEIYPPRDTQSEFANKVGLWLQGWHIIKNLIGFIELTDRSRTTLEIIHADLGELLGKDAKKEAA